MRGKTALAMIGAVVTGIACHACCWLPPLLITVGGSWAAAAISLEKYRLLFLLLTVAQLSVGFYLVYRRPKGACASGGERASQRRTSVAVMWGIAFFVITLNAFTFLQPTDHAHEEPVGATTSAAKH